MSRASRIVGIASLLMMSTAVTGIAPAGAAAPDDHLDRRAHDHASAAPGCRTATVQCSGLNESGQLGNGTHDHEPRPGHGEEHRAAPARSPASRQVVDRQLLRLRPPGQRHRRLLGRQHATASSATARHHQPTVLPVSVKNIAGTGPLTGVAQIAAGKYAHVRPPHQRPRRLLGPQRLLRARRRHQHPAPAARHPVLNGAGHGPLTGQINISVVAVRRLLGAVRRLGALLGPQPVRHPRRRHAASSAPLPSRVKAVTGTGFLANVKNVVDRAEPHLRAPHDRHHGLLGPQHLRSARRRHRHHAACARWSSRTCPAPPRWSTSPRSRSAAAPAATTRVRCLIAKTALCWGEQLLRSARRRHQGQPASPGRSSRPNTGRLAAHRRHQHRRRPGRDVRGRSRAGTRSAGASTRAASSATATRTTPPGPWRDAVTAVRSSETRSSSPRPAARPRPRAPDARCSSRAGARAVRARLGAGACAVRWCGVVGCDPRSTTAWGTNEGPEKAHMRARRERLGSC